MSFESDEELMHTIERILSPLGRRVDEAAPLADARLPDGSRVNCVIPPLSLDGPLLTIRRFRRAGVRGRGPGRERDAPRRRDAFLQRARRVRQQRRRQRRNRLRQDDAAERALVLRSTRAERIITIEDAAELRLQQPHVLRLESRPPNVEGRGRGDHPRSWSATRFACAPIGSSSARCAVQRRSTCCRR